MEKNQQELIFSLSMFEQKIQNLQQQMQAVDQSIIDLSSISLGLDEISQKESNEILAQIGAGIFARAKLISKDLIVNTGAGNLVKKTIPETKNLLNKQVEKLKEVKEELSKALEETGKELEKLMKDAEKMNSG